MAYYCVVASFQVRPRTNRETRDAIEEFFLKTFVPAEREAPGLLSIEMCTPYRGRIPHQPNNSASDYCLVELWKSYKYNHKWWDGDLSLPLSPRMQEVMGYFMENIEPHVEIQDCHYNVRRGHIQVKMRG
jgi:hypothetical protein